MITANLREFSSEPGSYALLLNLDQPHRFEIGSLGTVQLQTGLYIYLGSAWGPGGLRSRVLRHLRGRGALRWHIDYLRRVAQVLGVYTLPGLAKTPKIRLECLWSQALAIHPGAFLPVSGFGASDCRAGCLAHLVGFKDVPAHLPEVLSRVAGVPEGYLQYWVKDIEKG